jgi:hypothetical protein
LLLAACPLSLGGGGGHAIVSLLSSWLYYLFHFRAFADTGLKQGPSGSQDKSYATAIQKAELAQAKEKIRLIQPKINATQEEIVDIEQRISELERYLILH